MRSPIHVLIVDDSALIRQMLTRVLAPDAAIEIVGVAKNGVEAIEKAKSLNPDVITLDIEMPELNGLEALKQLHRHSGARVVMLSSLDDSDTVFQALSLGAVDFVAKPGAGMASSIDELSVQLRRVIRAAHRAHVRVISEEAAGGETAPAAVSSARSDAGPVGGAGLRAPERPPSLETLVAIGASTGGPPALEKVLAGLGPSRSVGYVIVQHLPEGFAPSLAKRLSAVGSVPVLLAEAGVKVEPGTAYLAPWGRHMLVERTSTGARLYFDSDTSTIHGVRPAADPLFRSVAETFGTRSVGVLLTGMGSDGAEGMLAIKRAGGATIAQDESTSVVWGMPGAAVRRKAVRRVVPIGLVAVEIRRSLRGRAD